MILQFEIKKILRHRIIYVPLFLVFVFTIYTEVVNGEFGYEYNTSARDVAVCNGKYVIGEEGYKINKQIADNHYGILSESLLEDVYAEYQLANYVEENNVKIYSYVYNYFENAFMFNNGLYKENLDVLCVDKVKYGYTGDWEAYYEVLEKLFGTITFFVIILSGYVFSVEKEYGVITVIETTRNGNSKYFYKKVKATFVIINIALIVLLLWVSVIHFGRYGFDNADVSVQCCSKLSMLSVDWNCCLGGLTVIKIVGGIVGVNGCMAICLLISAISNNTTTCVFCGLICIWVCNYDYVKMFSVPRIVRLIYLFFPINSCNTDNLMRLTHSFQQIAIVFVLELVFYFAVIVVLARKTWIKSIKG